MSVILLSAALVFPSQSIARKVATAHEELEFASASEPRRYRMTAAASEADAAGTAEEWIETEVLRCEQGCLKRISKGGMDGDRRPESHDILNPDYMATLYRVGDVWTLERLVPLGGSEPAAGGPAIVAWNQLERVTDRSSRLASFRVSDLMTAGVRFIEEEDGQRSSAGAVTVRLAVDEPGEAINGILVRGGTATFRPGRMWIAESFRVEGSLFEPDGPPVVIEGVSSYSDEGTPFLIRSVSELSIDGQSGGTNTVVSEPLEQATVIPAAECRLTHYGLPEPAFVRGRRASSRWLWVGFAAAAVLLGTFLFRRRTA